MASGHNQSHPYVTGEGLVISIWEMTRAGMRDAWASDSVLDAFTYTCIQCS